MRYDKYRDIIATEWSSNVDVDALDLSRKLDSCGKALTRLFKIEVDRLKIKITSYEKELAGLLKRVDTDGQLEEVSPVQVAFQNFILRMKSFGKKD